MTIGVYEIVNAVTGKRYIGSTADMVQRKVHHICELRKGDHKNAHLQHEFDKYGEDAFEFRVVLKCRPKDMIAHEQERIDLYDFESLYNLCPTAGSQKGRKHTAETRARMSAMRKGRVFSEEHRARISAAKMGHVASDETRAKMSAAAKRRAASDEGRARMSVARQSIRQRKSEEPVRYTLADYKEGSGLL